MDFKERLLTTMNHEEPDRVPVMGLIVDASLVDKIQNKKTLNFVNLLKKPILKHVIKFLVNRDSFMNKQLVKNFGNCLQSAMELGFDANWIMYQSLKMGDYWYDVNGRVWDITTYEDGVLTANYIRGLLKNKKDWRDWIEKNEPWFQKSLKFLEKFHKTLLKQYKDKIYPITHIVPGPWENSWQPIGFEEFTRYIYQDKDFLKEVVDFQNEYYIKMVKAVCRVGPEIVAGGDDLGHKTGPMLRPTLIDELYGDCYRQVSEMVHSKGKKILWHSCGRVYKLLDYFIDWGFDGVITLEPTAGMDLGKVREKVGHDLVLVGNLDVSYLLVRGSKKEIEDEVKNCIRKAARGGGYILAPCHSHAYVDPTRMKWMIEATHEFGKYPINA